MRGCGCGWGIGYWVLGMGRGLLERDMVLGLDGLEFYLVRQGNVQLGRIKIMPAPFE